MKNIKTLLLTPGPVEVSKDIIQSLQKPILHHRSGEFKKLFACVSKKLQKVYLTKNPVLTLHSNGTGAMEAALLNLVKRKDKVLILQNGVFSRRWAEIAKAHNITADVLKFPNGQSIDTKKLQQMLLKKGGGYKAVLFNHIETSTGAINDIKKISSLIKKYSESFTVCDAMSSIGSEPLYTDKWKLDIVITSSCKGLSNFAGLSFISVSKKVLNYIKQNKPKTFYFDLKTIYEKYKEYQTPFTASSVLFYAQNKTLDKILKKSLSNIWKETKVKGEYSRKLAKKTGFEIFPENPADTLTVLKMNKADFIVKQLKKRFNIEVAQGQKELKGNVIRFSNMLNVKKTDIDVLFSSLKLITGGGEIK